MYGNDNRTSILTTVYIMSGRFVWDIQTRGYGESCMSCATRTRMLEMACETLQFYGFNAIFMMRLL